MHSCILFVNCFHKPVLLHRSVVLHCLTNHQLNNRVWFCTKGIWLYIGTAAFQLDDFIWFLK